MRKIRVYCAACHKEIYDGDEYAIESDIRGVVRHIYHKKCVITTKK